jgi:valyl-tRNA synthetase
MDKAYLPNTIEQKWYQQWEENNCFAPNKTHQQSYCIMIPPPNVTGSLHMGHAFQDTIMDILIRYHRMKGFNTLWQVGTDHAGIATQMVVERQLLSQNVSRHDLGREKFVEKIWEWKNISGNTIYGQLKRLGASVDWSRERFTMDAGLSEAVTEVFVKLHAEGLLYRGQRLVNWDPILHTALSDLEVISQEEDGFLWHIRYPIYQQDKKTGEFLILATTRPETLLGDVAVAVHPEDTRYQHLIGQSLKLPLCDRLIPIIDDDFVDPAFGTGVVKITPAHDFNDYDVGKRHKLPLINIFTIDAKINENAPSKYQGMARFEARKQIVADLEQRELIEKIDPHKLQIPRGDRSGEIIEPYLTSQWFVKADVLAKKAIEVVETGQIKFVPENWSKTYFDWLNNIQDWCVSRQLWWGHRIPAWYDENGQIYVGYSEKDVRQKNNLADNVPLSQDEDVLDTWFSAGLWPFSTLGWPQKTPEYELYYPTDVLVTGFDIIFFWVARMVMLGLKFTDKIPFKTVYIHGLIQDQDGQKMSKSKGNVIDPLDIIDGIDLESLVAKRTTGLMQPQMAKKIEQNTRKQYPEGIAAYGTDALRFTFCALATFARHIRFDLKRVETYRNFCNKLWNASRYVLMNTENQNLGKSEQDREYSAIDLWILTELEKTKKLVVEHIQSYRFDMLASCLYDFTWNVFCDWYLELSKSILNSQESTAKQLAGTRYTLVSVLEQLMRLMHPIMPFITEEIWQRLAPLLGNTRPTIMLEPYPEFNFDTITADMQLASTEIEWVKALISTMRTLRNEVGVSPSQHLSIILTGASEDKANLSKHAALLYKLARLEQASFLDANQKPPISAIGLASSTCQIHLPLQGLIDKNAEIARLKKEMDKLQKEVQKSEVKLGNENYVRNAPKEIVDIEHARLADHKKSYEKLNQQLGIVQQLP